MLKYKYNSTLMMALADVIEYFLPPADGEQHKICLLKIAPYLYYIHGGIAWPCIYSSCVSDGYI